MLEKIGLPPKPSVRGNTWVVDASHCQGCSAQFTFINRKHHCRRCGGIFCNSCTQQRMLLRGQGDSPVRICDPCKSLEEAARFERYGHKNRAVRGSSRLASKKEDDILNQILGHEDSSSQMTSSASSSNYPEVVSQGAGGDLARNLSLDQPTNMLTEVESATPEELREQATLEKKKYSTLKAEGKREEALRAFKRGKELERQAAALEITLKRNRKRPLPFSNPGDVKTASGKSTLSGQKSKPKDDLTAELKELGWSDMDVHDSEKKTSVLSVEGELASLLREVAPPKAENEKKVITADKAQVIALKKRALELKRSGNLNEAKEELKRAKILERKIEEEELLGGDDDSDDELSALIRSMDSDEHDEFTATRSDLNFSFDHFIDNGDDLAMDGNFEVTEDDMDDPEIASALKSLGWAEDVSLSEDNHEQAAPSKSEQLQTEILSLKREALSHKRAGNTAEAMALLRKAKLLETELESFEHGSDLIDLGSAVSQTGPFPRAAEEPKPARKSKLVIQRELIALKKKALSLRREGKVDESEEELRKAKVLEQQLEETNIAPATTEPNIIKRQAVNDAHDSHLSEGEDEVTDQDMYDPSYLSLLKNLGWEEEDNMKSRSSMLNENDESFTHTSGSSITGSASNFRAGTSRKSRSEIQRELLALKRKALTLRRQGEAEEADEVLKMAKLLEAQLQEYEEPIQREVSTVNNKELETRAGDSVKEEKVRLEKPEETVQVSVNPGVSQPSSEPRIHESSSSEPSVSQTSPGSLKQEILAHKRNAISLKREGKLAEAKAELWQAKLLEKRAEAETFQTTIHPSDASTSPDASASPDVPSSVDKKETSHILDSKSLSSRDKFKIQQKSLGHKRQAVKLRREGKTAEADAEFELAKALESQLHESDFQDPKTIDQVEETSETSLNSSNASTNVPSATKKEASPSSVTKPLSGRDRFKIQQKSLGHKRQALKLRREGKTAEADAEFELAKALESQLQELDSQDSKTSEQVDDVTVEDFLDPQLLSALQSIGLEDVQTKIPGKERPESTNSVTENVDNGDMEREQLAERIKAEKVKAVNLKRSGKQAEALDALRRAKLYEKKLQSLTPPM